MFNFPFDNLETVSSLQIKTWLDNLKVSESTRYLRFSQIRALFNKRIKENLLQNNDGIRENPCEPISHFYKKPRINRPPIDPDIEAKMENLYQKLNKKYQIIFSLGIRGGLRVSEICNLKPSDVMRQNGAALVRLIKPKSGADQEFAPIPLEVWEMLQNYIKERGIKEKESIFKTSRQSVWSVLKSKGCEPHDLRRYAAYRWQKAGKSLKAIQGMLRHSSVQTTELYLRNLSIEAISKEMEGL